MAPAVDPARTPGGAPPPARPILLVEDDEAHAEIVRRAFEGFSAAFELITVGSLQEARARLAERPIDLIISDWNLPDGQGIDLLPANADALGLAVLLMTSQGTEQMAVRALKAGSVDYVVKSTVTLAEMPHLAERALQEWDNLVARRRAEDAIRVSLREKEALLQEIHHRVKNNLQIVSSLLQLQANEIEDPELLAIFEASQTRIHAMALIHDMLYRSESLAKIDLETYLRGLVSMLMATYCKGPIRPRLDLNVCGCIVNTDTAISLGLIANELVTNSLKYAFPNNRPGRISLTCEQLPDGERMVQISDDGVGLPPGVSIEGYSSLGIKLVGMFTRRLRGDGMWRADGQGLGYSLRFRERTVSRAVS